MDFDSIVYFSKQFSTILFFSFFILVVFYAYKKDNKEKIEAIKYSIFEEDEIRGLL